MLLLEKLFNLHERLAIHLRDIAIWIINVIFNVCVMLDLNIAGPTSTL